MRRILVENARRKKTAKAGGHQRRVALSDVAPAIEEPRVDLLALDEALALLEAKDKRKAEVVKLRFFAGLTNAQAAEALGISPATAENDWAYAKTWLRVTMRDDRDEGPVPG
jgi:RNA polymerase sigma factor (TIGR02999 family)